MKRQYLLYFMVFLISTITYLKVMKLLKNKYYTYWMYDRLFLFLLTYALFSWWGECQNK